MYVGISEDGTRKTVGRDMIDKMVKVVIFTIFQ